MTSGKIAINKITIIISTGAAVTTTAALTVLWVVTGSAGLVLCGAAIALLLLFWMSLFVVMVRKKLEAFTSAICQTIDDMMSDNARPQDAGDDETLFVKINHRLKRLYDVLRESLSQAAAERARLQELISDISHQVKTPIANLKMANDLLLGTKTPPQKQRELLHATAGQLDKLDFLMQAMVKTSRLEAGVIALLKKDCPIYGTLAAALGGVLLGAEKKRLTVTVDCPEDLSVPHDVKWTTEALFNILDNAVKYTSEGGSIRVSTERWEFYTRIDISDTGKGIPESRHADIFKRFYRGEDVHELEGIGIGLYLAREIITMQGGYIKVTSEAGAGSTFSVFLPNGD